MHLYDAIEEYNFEHGKHFDPATGQYDLLMPHDLGRPLTHEEMDYNFLYQKQTMNGFRIFGSGANLRLNDDDTDKVLKFHKIDPADDNYIDYENTFSKEVATKINEYFSLAKKVFTDVHLYKIIRQELRKFNLKELEEANNV